MIESNICIHLLLFTTFANQSFTIRNYFCCETLQLLHIVLAISHIYTSKINLFERLYSKCTPFNNKQAKANNNATNINV
jgi:hypothetical protein